MGSCSRGRSSLSITLAHSRRFSQNIPARSRTATRTCKSTTPPAPLVHYLLSIRFFVPSIYMDDATSIPTNRSLSLFRSSPFSFSVEVSFVRFTISRARVPQKNQNLSRFKNREISKKRDLHSSAMCIRVWGDGDHFFSPPFPSFSLSSFRLRVFYFRRTNWSGRGRMVVSKRPWSTTRSTRKCKENRCLSGEGSFFCHVTFFWWCINYTRMLYRVFWKVLRNCVPFETLAQNRYDLL